ncbi:MAG: DUF2189 domain-containing protein [Methylobacteriaceae bacterium]|nr:DUF2189 domain-containing protein [Methylobacteriaceae bacterium]
MSARVATSNWYTRTEPAVRAISIADLLDALRKGASDFVAMPSHLIFLGLLYPILGVVLASLAFGYDVWPIIYPLITGFALVGPLAGLGLYELSRRREAGAEPSWSDAFEVLRTPALPSVIGLGLVLVILFLAWLLAAEIIFGATIGSIRHTAYVNLLGEILTTEQGWALILVGNLVGACFAALVLAVSVIGFPLILDRQVGLGTAVRTSVRAVRRNPVTMAAWGLIVAALLALGSAPLFVGLVVVMPILGHATWHLYRKVVAE